MNRRSFMRTLAGAVAGFTVLPPATTYERVWRVARPQLVEMAFQPVKFAGLWYWVRSDSPTAFYYGPTLPAWRYPQFTELRTIEGGRA